MSDSIQNANFAGHRARLVARRAIYASAMGVDNWFARKPLAADTNYLLLKQSEYTAPDLASSSKPSGDSVTSASKDTAAASARLALKALVDSPAARSAGQQRTPQSATDREQIADALVTDVTSTQLPARFELGLAMLGDVLVLDDVTQRQCAPSVYQNWLAALALALNKPLQRIKSNEGNALRWPDVLGSMASSAGSQAGQSLEAATEVVSAWMLRKISSRQSCLMLMGEVPNQLFSEQGFAQLSQLNPMLAEAAVIRAPSSIEIWSSAEYKRQLWRQLAPIRSASPSP